MTGREIATVTVACNTCGSAAAAEVARVKDLELETCRNEFVFVRCDGCGHVYLRNRPADSELATIYPPEYYRYEAFLGRFGSWARRRSQQQKARFISGLVPPAARILDVGCGTGELLRSLKAVGNHAWSLCGVDISAEALAGLSRQGIDAIAARFEEVDLPADSADLIVMNQTIEHVSDPRGTLQKACTLLKPGGVLLVETPSLDAWDARWFPPELWAGWHCPRHWNLYTPESLTRLARACGFDEVRVTPLPSPYFWLRSTQHLVRTRLGWTRVAGVIDERSLPLLALAVAVDALQARVRGRTSNQRMVARKRKAAARGPAS
jgi:SAM-dependent methyltransferase